MSKLFLAQVESPVPSEGASRLSDTAEGAWAWLAIQRTKLENATPPEAYEPGDPEQFEMSDCYRTLVHIAKGDHQHGNRHEDTPTAADGSGQVLGSVPGTPEGPSMVYSVRVVAPGWGGADFAEQERAVAARTPVKDWMTRNRRVGTRLVQEAISVGDRPGRLREIVEDVFFGDDVHALVAYHEGVVARGDARELVGESGLASLDWAELWVDLQLWYLHRGTKWRSLVQESLEKGVPSHPKGPGEVTYADVKAHPAYYIDIDGPGRDAAEKSPCPCGSRWVTDTRCHCSE